MHLTTLEFGPCYNPLLKNGLPVLGSWMESSTLSTLNALSLSNHPLKSYVPLPGPVILKSIWLSKDHDIQYDCGIRDDIPALLIQEDFDVATILVFFEKIDARPDFSLVWETRELFRKKWHPSWLACTDMGRTLYACRQFLDALVFNTSSFETARKEIFFNPNWYEPVIKMLEDLQYLIKKSAINRSQNVAYFDFANFKQSIHGKIDNIRPNLNNWRIDIQDVPINFYIGDQEGNIIEPASSFLNFNREAFPQLIPNFERLRQIHALIKGLICLREAGYRMPEEMKENYRNIKLHYEELLHQKKSTNYCNLLPLKE